MFQTGVEPTDGPPPQPIRRPRPWLVWATLVRPGLVWATLVVAVAALVVGSVDLLRDWPGGSVSVGRGSESPATSTPTVEAADRQLCQAMGPLMANSLKFSKDFVGLGAAGSPARDAGIPPFQTAVSNWVGQIQPVLDAHADPSRFLVRSTQAYVDDLRLYADNVGPGPATDYDDAVWTDGTARLGAAIGVCGPLGITWWKS